MIGRVLINNLLYRTSLGLGMLRILCSSSINHLSGMNVSSRVLIGYRGASICA